MPLETPLAPLVGGYRSLEGPAFAEDGGLFFVDWLAHSIQRLGPDGRTLVVTECETGMLYRGRARVPGLRLFGGQRWGA